MSQLNLGKVVGRGVQSFSKTKTEGLTDTYTMAYTDGTSSAIEITHNSKNNYTDSAVAEVAKIATKVDKVDGKGLSTNDLTNELKASYDGAVTKANNADNKVNDINVLGWVVPDACPIKNYVGDDGKFHQLVDRVDLGSLEWVTNGGVGFYSAGVENTAVGSAKCFCNKYPASTTVWADNSIGIASSKTLWIADNSYTDATAFKSAMSGVYLYYELATPKVLDIDGNEVVVDTFRDSAPAHNGIFRGKDLTNIYSIDEICSRISDGTFRDLYIGDYFDITIDGEGSEVVRCVLAGFDTYLHNGDTSHERHHAVVVTKNCLTTIHSMNSTNTTAGGYLGSDMWTTVLPIYNTAFGTVLGDHLLSHRAILTNTVSTTGNSNAGAGFTGYSSDWAWVDTKLSLLSEIQVYGSNVFSSSFYDTGNENLQLPLFALDPTAKVCSRGGITNTSSSSRQWYWLRNVASGTHFACVGSKGNSYCDGASGSNGVRPLFCIG